MPYRWLQFSSFGTTDHSGYGIGVYTLWRLPWSWSCFQSLKDVMHTWNSMCIGSALSFSFPIVRRMFLLVAEWAKNCLSQFMEKNGEVSSTNKQQCTYQSHCIIATCLEQSPIDFNWMHTCISNLGLQTGWLETKKMLLTVYTQKHKGFYKYRQLQNQHSFLRSIKYIYPGDGCFFISSVMAIIIMCS